MYKASTFTLDMNMSTSQVRKTLTTNKRLSQVTSVTSTLTFTHLRNYRSSWVQCKMGLKSEISLQQMKYIKITTPRQHTTSICGWTWSSLKRLGLLSMLNSHPTFWRKTVGTGSSLWYVVSKTTFIRRISAVSNAIQTIDNEANHLIIYCLNCMKCDVWTGPEWQNRPRIRDSKKKTCACKNRCGYNFNSLRSRIWKEIYHFIVYIFYRYLNSA